MDNAPMQSEHDTSLRIAAPDMLQLLKHTRDFLANSGAESGCCMCGDPVAMHSIASGHAPVDSYGYYADGLIAQIDATIAKSTQ